MRENEKAIKGYRVDGTPIFDYRTGKQRELERKFEEIIRRHFEEIRG